MFLCSSITAISQNDEQVLNHQVGIHHDNDFFTLTDRYYSSGLYLSYKHRLKKGLLKKGSEQLSFRFGQQAYTPAQTRSENIEEFDRPYAGFLGLWSNWSWGLANTIVDVEILTGIAGPASGAAEFQSWYHTAVAISDPPLWVNQLENSFHLNLYARYTLEWHLSDNPFSVIIASRPQLALGSRDIYVQPEVMAYFGRRAFGAVSIANDRLTNGTKELYVAIGGAYRFVGYNGLIEGNGFGDSSSFTTEVENSLFILKFDFRHRNGPNDYIVGYRFMSSETPMGLDHQYLTLTYARSF